MSASRRNSLRYLSLPLFATCAVVPTSGQAQQVALEEIIVTTQKREQSLLDVPLTVTAYSGDFLDSIGVEEFDALSLYVPGFVVQEQSVNNPGFVIRGITSDSGDSQIAPRVSVYLDGVDVSRSRGSVFELFDLERVEVIKGPQATLFGSAASVGAVSVITARPQEEFGAQVSAGVGNFDEIKTRGHITGGSDTVQGRLAWIYKKREGFIDNIAGEPGSQTPGGPEQEDLNGTETLAVRGSVQFTPNENLTANVIASYQKDTPPASSFKSGTIAPTGGDTNPNTFAELSGSPFTVEHLGDELGIDRETIGLTVLVDYDFSDSWSFSSISAYREFDSLEVFDADGTAAFWLEFAEDAESEQWSQEFRFNYTGEQLSGFFGVSYFDENGSQSVPFSTDEGVFAACSGFVPGLPCVNADGSVNSIFPVAVPYTDTFGNTGDQQTFSVYADGTYYITSDLDVTVGLRYIYDKRESGAFGTGNPAALTGGLAPLLPFGNTGGTIVTGSDSFDAVLPRFNVHYRLEENFNVYATVGKGRRADLVDVAGSGGAANPTATVTILPAETIWNYEAGFKATTEDSRVSYEASVFYQQYKNFQTSIQNQATGLFDPVNAGEASMKGAEMSVTAKLLDVWDGFFNLGYIDAEFNEFDSDGNAQQFGGNQFRLTPEWSISGGLNYQRAATEEIDFFFTPTWSYRSTVFFENSNANIAGLPIKQEGLHQLNLRLGLRDDMGRWEVAAYMDNATDEEYIIDAGNTGGVFGTPTFIAGPPRFFGVEVTASF